MKKGISIYVIVAFLTIVSMIVELVYKNELIKKYDISTIDMSECESFYNEYTNKDNVSVDLSHRDLKNYSSIKNIRLQEKYVDYEQTIFPEDYTTMAYLELTDESGKVVDNVSITKDQSYLKVIACNDVNILLALQGKQTDSKLNLDSLSIPDYLFEKNITNDLELFDYIFHSKNEKFNLLTSASEIKNKYGIYYIASMILPKINSYTEISGDLKGYILDMGDSKEVNVITDENCYSFVLKGQSAENVDEFVDNIIIVKEEKKDNEE